MLKRKKPLPRNTKPLKRSPLKQVSGYGRKVKCGSCGGRQTIGDQICDTCGGVGWDMVPVKGYLRRKKPISKRGKALVRSALRRRPGKPKRFAKLRDPQYLEWIRGLPCILKGKRHPHGMPHECYLPVEATHVRSRGAGGGDFGNVVPCDGIEHANQHTGGLKSWAEYWFGENGLMELRRIAAEVYPAMWQKSKELGWPN